MSRPPWAAGLLLCALFIAIGVPWLDKPGIQTDEALFAAGIYPPHDARFVVHGYPLMIMPYVGAVKSFVWRIIFAFWAPSPYSVRVPAVLLSALSIWWTYRLMLLTLGIRAALAGTALLATDPVYLMYSRYDHGPVVLQHLCMVGAMLALVRFHRERRTMLLAVGFFALGLGMWEKAIFAWVLSGMAMASFVLFRRQIKSMLNGRNLAVAAASFVLGAAPLLLFNAMNPLATFRGTTTWSTEYFTVKAGVLRRTLEGNVLLGSIVRDPWEGPLREPSSRAERATVSTSLAAGMPRRGWMGYLAIAAVLLIPFVWRTEARSAALFVLIAGTVAWLQMALIQGAGTGAHHTILLWPLPVIGIAAVLGYCTEKIRFGPRVLAIFVAAASVANVLVVSTYYTNLLRNGGTASWSDAVYPAIDALRKMDKSAICVVDWGFRDTLRMYEQGRVELPVAADPVTEEGRQAALLQISQPGYVFLTHTVGNELFPGITARLIKFAESNGFRQVGYRGFADSNGRETVATFRFVKTAQNSSGGWRHWKFD